MFERSSKTRVRNFFKNQSFYIILVACIMVVGVAAVIALTWQPEPAQNDPSKNVQKQQAPTLQEELDKNELETDWPSEPEDDAIAESPLDIPSEENPAPAKAKTVTLKMPIEGEIIKSFSKDKLVFNETLNMFATHNGIDISADQGSKVVAAYSGEVSSIETDQNKGLMVKIEHENSQYTVYSGLEEAKVKKGDKVSSGDEIGTVGIPAFEAAQGAHIHFEYIIDSKYVDPQKYLESEKN